MAPHEREKFLEELELHFSSLYSLARWMTIDGLIEEMKGNPTFQPAFESEEKPGTGSKPGDNHRQVDRGHRVVCRRRM